jgi:hypothetical protein
VLYVGRQDGPACHRGTVVRLHESPFASPPDAVRDHRLGRQSAAAFRILYLDHRQALWRQAPEAFLRLIAPASGGSGALALASGGSGALALASGASDLTLVDDGGDADDAPRRILAAALEQLAATRRDTARRAQRRQGAAPPSPSRPGDS